MQPSDFPAPQTTFHGAIAVLHSPSTSSAWSHWNDYPPALARLEARVLFEELLRSWPRLERPGEPEPLCSSPMNRFERMPVTLRS